MGLFSKLRGGTAATDPVDDIARGLLSMPFLMAAADGNIDKTEIDEIIRMCALNPVFHQIGAPRTTELANEIIKDLQSQGANAVFERGVQALSPALRETALCFSVRVAVADGHIDQSEKDTLAALGQRMDIPVEQFMQIVDVLMMLQRPATA